MNEDVLEPWLDLMPRQGIIAEIGDRSLEGRTVAAGDMDRSPENRRCFDPGHLSEPARGLIDRFSGGLIGNEPGIAGHLIGRALRDDMAVRKIDDTLTAFGLVHVVGRDEGSQTFARHVVNGIPEFAPGFGIDTGGGLVEQQQLWLVQYTGGERQPLLPAAGEVPGKLVRAPSEAHSLHDLLNRLPAVAQLIDAGDEVEVLEHCEIFVEAETLGHVADLTPNTRRT